MSRTKVGVIAVFLFLTAALSLQALKVGDHAPPLIAEHWFNGDAVDPSQSDGETTYIVEFWATWCPPCKKSIPHLNALHDQYSTQRVVFVGVTTENRETVEPFIKKMNIRYRVAIARKDAIDDTWMKDVEGIPHAYVVDTNGVIVWTGHPMDRLDEVLAEIVQGTYDANKWASEEFGDEGLEKFQNLLEEDRIDEALTFLDKKLSVPQPNPMFYQLKIALLAEADRAADVKALYRQMVERYWDDAQQLNQIAWMAVTAPFKLCDLDAARQAAERAVILTKQEDAAVLDTLARIYYAVGLLPQAIATQEQAVQRATDEDMKKELRAVLEYYHSAKKIAQVIASRDSVP